MVKEIGMADVPLPEGYVGNLTDEQDKKLKQMWLEFFDCCEKASGSKSKGEGNANLSGGDDDAEQDPKKAGIPKGDEAKEEAKRAEEEKAMKELQSEYGSEALRTSFWRFVKFDDADTIMLRFLRARKWDVSRAIAMLAGCIKWRLDNGVEELAEQGDLTNGEKVEKFLDQQRSGKTYALGTASNEQPICYIHVGKHLTFAQPGTSMQKYVIYAMESFRLLMMPPNDKAVILFDMTGFGLKNMDWNCVLFIVKCLEAYFPESLGIMFVHNAPWLFSGIWKVLSPLLDPVVRAKVRFTKGPKDVEDRIPIERFLDSLKGNTTSKFEFVEPEKGENDLQNDKEERQKRFDAYMELAKQYEDETRKWSNSGDKASEKRLLLVRKLRVAQFEMEPYWRGKTVAHRDGTLDGQGIVTWLYKQKDGESVRHIVGRRDCVAVMKREIKEIEEGGSSHDAARKKTDKAIEESDYVTLYGDEETAQRIEGSRVNGQIPPEGWLSEQTKKSGGVLQSIIAKAPADDSAKASKSGDAAAGAAAGTAAGAGAAAASKDGETEQLPAKDTFQDAPQAEKKDAEQAVDGDKKVDAKADTAEGGGAAPDAVPQANGTSSNGDAKPNGNAAATTKAKAVEAKEDIKKKGSSFGSRMSKMFGSATA